MTWVSSATTRRANALPMLPKPTIPTVSPCNAPTGLDGCDCQTPALTSLYNVGAPIPGQEEGESMVRHFAGPDIGNVDRHDPQVGCRRDIDHVIADAGSHYHFQLFESAHHPTRHGRRRYDQRIRVTGALDDLVLLSGKR